MDISSIRLSNLFPSAKQLLEGVKQVPFWSRLLSLSLALCIIRAFTCLSIKNRYTKLQALTQEVLTLDAEAQRLEKQKQMGLKIKEIASYASSDYLTQIETMPLLQAERQRVAALIKQFPENSSLKERLFFLDSGKNQLRFERVLENPGRFIEYRLSHPVQMDLSDLRNFLVAVEGDRYDAPQGKPFLVMKKFDLRKHHEKGDEKIYSIDVELLQPL